MEGDALPSPDDMNDIIMSVVESETPTESGMSEDDAETLQLQLEQEARFRALCDASTEFPPHLTNEQFLAACEAWLQAHPLA